MNSFSVTESLREYVRRMKEPEAKTQISATTAEFPLQVLPMKLQRMVRDLERVENYPRTLLVASLLSAAATAIGNAMQVHIKGNWSCAPILYVMLVARAGVGKSPAIQFAYRPLREVDSKRLEIFCKELETWLARDMKNPDEANQPKPSLSQFVISDFTPEAMARAHRDNRRGITVVADELIAIYNTKNRYSDGALVETQLSIWSQSSIKVNRCSLDVPISIRHPFVGILGGIQPSLLPGLIHAGYNQNGLLDRYIIVSGSGLKVPRWSNEQSAPTDASPVWTEIITTLLSLPYDPEKPHTLDMTDEARDRFFDWHNSTVDSVNAGQRGDDTRFAKLPVNAARIALVLQLLKWACGEGTREAIELDSVEGAITLLEYWEHGAEPLMRGVYLQSLTDQQQSWLESLYSVFTTTEATAAGESVGLRERTVYRLLKNFASKGIIKRMNHGKYEKKL